MFSGSLDDPAAFRGQVMCLFSFERESAVGDAAFADFALKGAGTKWKYFSQPASIDHYLTVAIVFAAQQPNQLKSGAAVQISAGMYMQIAVMSFKCHLKVGAHV